jgi:hypothetical protein
MGSSRSAAADMEAEEAYREEKLAKNILKIKLKEGTLDNLTISDMEKISSQYYCDHEDYFLISRLYEDTYQQTYTNNIRINIDFSIDKKSPALNLLLSIRDTKNKLEEKLETLRLLEEKIILTNV